jgi:hypothetical protein
MSKSPQTQQNNKALYCVFTICILSLIVAFTIVVLGIESEQSETLLQSCTDLLKIGLGAITGLIIGSKYNN